MDKFYNPYQRVKKYYGLNIEIAQCIKYYVDWYYKVTEHVYSIEKYDIIRYIVVSYTPKFNFTKELP